MKNNDLVFIGIKGSAVALNRANGMITWETPLGGGGFVHLVLADDNLYATTQGEVFCLDPATGKYRWANKLKGYGLGLASIAAPHSSDDGLLVQVAADEQLRAQQASAAVAASV